MKRIEVDVDRTVLLRWLSDVAEPADLIETACDDFTSRTIRFGARGRSSHVALVVDEGWLVEAYDRKFTIREDDGGLFELDFPSFVARGELRRVEIRRPRRVNAANVCSLARHAVTHSPPFASLGSVMIAGLGIAELPVREVGRRLARGIQVAGDGIARLNCAEFPARIYTESGFQLEFENPRLGKLMKALSAEQDLKALSGRLVDVPPRRAWSADPSLPYGLDVVDAYRRRIEEDTPADWADLVMPTDFARSPKFDLVGAMELGTDGLWHRAN